MTLEFARRVSYPPGSNRPGAAAPPAWFYLLPSLEGWSAVPVGAVDPRLLEGLKDPSADRGGRPLLLVGAVGESEIRDALSRHAGAPVYADSSAAATVASVLGVTREWWLAPARDDRDGAHRDQERDATATGDRAALHVPVPPTVGGGGRVAAARAKAQRVLARFARRAGLHRPVPGRLAADDPSGVPLAPGPEPDGGTEASGVFFPPDGEGLHHVPEWIAEIARPSGADLAGASWRMVPSRGFRSQKILFLVTPGSRAVGAEAENAVAVKITQDERFNPRLENEYHGLAAFAQLNGVDPATFPRPLFVGHHRRLAVVGQAAVAGAPFRARSDASPGCRLAGVALEWLETAASASARPAPAGESGQAIGELVNRFIDLYAPGADTERTLRADVERLGSSPDLPTVFLHGDPGPWNLVVTRDDRVAFLDWENAEPHGLPLWDLLYFVRTYGAFAAERRGIRWTPKVFADQYLEETAFSAQWEASVEAHVRRLGLPRPAVPALLRTGLAAFAAREAWSLDPRRLHRGVSVRLLDVVMARAGASAVWRRLGAGR